MLEAAGTPSSLRTAVASARKGGKIVGLGVVREEVDYRSILDIVSRGFVPLVERPREFVKLQVSATRDATAA